MSTLTLGQKKAILVLAGILLLVCSYFLVFQKTMSNASDLEQDTKRLNSEITRLSALQVEIEQTRDDAISQQELTNNFTNSFPCKVPEESAIYNVYRMMVKSGMEISSITPGTEQSFLVGGKFISFDGRTGVDGGTSTDTAAADGETSAVEENPETRVSLHEMIGKTVEYNLQVSGTLKQIFKAIDWVEDNDQPMSVTGLSFAYDSTNGKLTGTMSVFFHALNGNGITYEDPVDVDDFDIGTDKLFGMLKEK
jgi:hypothetical protein